MKEQFYQNFFNTLEEAVLRLVKPKMVFTLSGGLDTRVLAGILASNNIHLSTVSFGGPMERLIASHVSNTLNFKQPFSSNFKLNSMLGLKFLHDKGFDYLLTGNFFDEINGSWIGCKAKTEIEFKKASEWHLRLAGIEIIDGNVKYLRNNIYPITFIYPLLDSKVLQAINKISWQWRKCKQIQKWILKTKFPKLWNIPNSNSMLPPFFPFYVHAVNNVLIHKPYRIIETMLRNEKLCLAISRKIRT